MSSSLERQKAGNIYKSCQITVFLGRGRRGGRTGFLLFDTFFCRFPLFPHQNVTSKHLQSCFYCVLFFEQRWHHCKKSTGETNWKISSVWNSTTFLPVPLINFHGIRQEGLSQQPNQQQHDESEIQFWLEVKAACDYTFGLIQTSLLLLGLCSALIPKLTFRLCVCSVKGDSK